MAFCVYARIGKTGSGFSSFDTSGLNTDNEISTVGVALPFSCRVYRLFAYFAGNGAAVTAQLVAWLSDLSGNARTPSFTAPSGSAATGGQVLNSGYSDGNAKVFSSDVAVWIGFFRAPGGSSVWSVLGSGTFLHKSSSGLDNFGGNAGCGAPYTCGDIEAFCDVVGGDMMTMTRGYPAYTRRRRAL